jgi:hypothetical protein
MKGFLGAWRSFVPLKSFPKENDATYNTPFRNPVARSAPAPLMVKAFSGIGSSLRFAT